MRGMDLFCSSPAATAVRSSMSTGRRSDYQGESPKLYIPCLSSQMPLIPRPYEKSRKSSSSSSSPQMPLIPRPYEKSRKSSSDHRRSHELRRKSSAEVNDLRSRSCGASRYHLSDHHRASVGGSTNSNWLMESKDRRDLALVTFSDQFVKPKHVISSDHDSNSLALKSSSSAGARDQVVVLRVSIHCKGCEGKVRKHISKMKGVTSFSIDLERKKVTVVGAVTPSDVLTSISKVKKAQFWPSQPPPAPWPQPSRHHLLLD